MRAARFLLKLTVFGLVAVACSCCRNASREEQGGFAQSSEAPSIEDSGKRLSGDFVLNRIEDDYGNKSLQGKPVSTFRFEESGAFKIERESGGTVLSVEEGTYIISPQNVLVLYVEKVGGEFQSEARIHQYVITERSADQLKLQHYPSATLVLRGK
jgi:hypothetical protein